MIVTPQFIRWIEDVKYLRKNVFKKPFAGPKGYQEGKVPWVFGFDWKWSPFLQRVVPADESWVLEYDPQTKLYSVERHTSTSPRPKEARMSNRRSNACWVPFSIGNRMRGIAHKQFVRQDEMVKPHFYRGVLAKLRQRIIRVRLNMKNNWVLHYDNALCHTAISINKFLPNKTLLWLLIRLTWVPVTVPLSEIEKSPQGNSFLGHLKTFKQL